MPLYCLARRGGESKREISIFIGGELFEQITIFGWTAGDNGVECCALSFRLCLLPTNVQCILCKTNRNNRHPFRFFGFPIINVGERKYCGAIFFVLTGFLVGLSCFRSNHKGVAYVLTKAINRYFRLFVICAMATLLTAATMVLGLQRHLEIVDIVADGAFLKGYCNFSPTLGNLLENIFIKPFVSGSDYVGPFWTIPFELWGYIAVMIAAIWLKDSKWRRVAYVLIGLAIFLIASGNYSVFFFGLFISDLVAQPEKETILSKYYRPFLYKKGTIVVLSIVGLYCASCPLSFVGIHAPLNRVPLLSPTLVRAAGVSMLVFCVSQIKSVQRFFEKKPFMFLGDLSFPIYAFHWPLMLTVEAGLFKYFMELDITYDVAAVSAFLLTLPVIILVSYIVYRITLHIKPDVSACINKMCAVIHLSV